MEFYNEKYQTESWVGMSVSLCARARVLLKHMSIAVLSFVGGLEDRRHILMHILSFNG